MTKDDVLFGYRQQLFAEAAGTSVSAACWTFGVHPSTYYHWKRQVDRHGLEMLRSRERRRPQMPNALPKMIEERIVSFSIAHPGLGPRRLASELAREKWGAIIVSANGVWKVLCRHGLNTRAKRLGLIAGYAAPYEPPRDPAPEQHIDVQRPGDIDVQRPGDIDVQRPGELVAAQPGSEARLTGAAGVGEPHYFFLVLAFLTGPYALRACFSQAARWPLDFFLHAFSAFASFCARVKVLALKPLTAAQPLTSTGVV
jgi:transposase